MIHDATKKTINESGAQCFFEKIQHVRENMFGIRVKVVPRIQADFLSSASMNHFSRFFFSFLF